MSTNLKRAAWAKACISLFADMTGTENDEQSIGDLICNLGHYAQRRNLDFLQLVQTGIGHWHLEQIDPDSLDMLPTVTVSINPHERH